jgi:hypothetical protein
VLQKWSHVIPTSKLAYLNAWCELTTDGYPEGAPSR